jgi:aryl-alcohol dehydrogenase-like predicted oxidoreductase
MGGIADNRGNSTSFSGVFLMQHLNRRHFLRNSMAGAGLLAASPTLLRGQEQAAAGSFKGTDIVPLGKTGIQVSRLAQGTGYNGYNHSSAHTRQGKEAFDRLLRHSLDEGISFIDMADLYGSHPFVKDVVKGLPRDKYVLLTKLWPRKADWVTPSGGAKQEMDRYRSELNVDQIEICLMHCMTDDQWPTEHERIRDELSELKDKNVIRAVGVSCHDFGALKVAAQHPWVDVIFARINHIGGQKYSCDASAEELAVVLKQARQNGKAVVGMKIFGAGKLVEPEQKDASLKFVFNNGLVDAITIGMLNPGEVDDTLQHMAQVA